MAGFKFIVEGERVVYKDGERESSESLHVVENLGSWEEVLREVARIAGDERVNNIVVWSDTPLKDRLGYDVFRLLEITIGKGFDIGIPGFPVVAMPREVVRRLPEDPIARGLVAIGVAGITDRGGPDSGVPLDQLGLPSDMEEVVREWLSYVGLLREPWRAAPKYEKLLRHSLRCREWATMLKLGLIKELEKVIWNEFGASMLMIVRRDAFFEEDLPEAIELALEYRHVPVRTMLLEHFLEPPPRIGKYLEKVRESIDRAEFIDTVVRWWGRAPTQMPYLIKHLGITPEKLVELEKRGVRTPSREEMLRMVERLRKRREELERETEELLRLARELRDKYWYHFII